jgi:hypothetical protein
LTFWFGSIIICLLLPGTQCDSGENDTRLSARLCGNEVNLPGGFLGFRNGRQAAFGPSFNPRFHAATKE